MKTKILLATVLTIAAVAVLLAQNKNDNMLVFPIIPK